VIINKKIIVCYLFTKFDNVNDILDFVKNYKTLSSGCDHSLLICLKLVDNIKKDSIFEILNKNDIKYELFIDPSTNNDFDFGSYYRVAEKFKDYLIFYLNSSSKPITDNWLKLIVNKYEDNSLIGTTASFESLTSSIKVKKFYKIFSYFIKKIFYLINFKTFPNPHIRTTGFLINSKNYIEFFKDKNCKNKYDAWKIESGKKGLTNYFLKKGFPIKLVNSDGISFEIDNWPKSNTYCYSDKSRLIISDKHTRKYDLLNLDEKKFFKKSVWGD